MCTVIYSTSLWQLTIFIHLAVHSHDSFWVETFHRYYIEVDDSKRGRDDLLFYVKLDSKQVGCIKVYHTLYMYKYDAI